MVYKHKQLYKISFLNLNKSLKNLVEKAPDQKTNNRSEIWPDIWYIRYLFLQFLTLSAVNQGRAWLFKRPLVDSRITSWLN